MLVEKTVKVELGEYGLNVSINILKLTKYVQNSTIHFFGPTLFGFFGPLVIFLVVWFSFYLVLWIRSTDLAFYKAIQLKFVNRLHRARDLRSSFLQIPSYKLLPTEKMPKVLFRQSLKSTA